MDEFSCAAASSDATPPAQPGTQSALQSSGQISAADANADRGDTLRIKLAWANLLWLLVFLGVLLAVSYAVPYVIEETQYASRRGQRRADYELAKAALKDNPLGQLSLASQQVTHKLAPSVVHISARQQAADLSVRQMGMSSSLFQVLPPGQGSGVIVDGARGYIITNSHVVENSSEITVRLAEGKPLSATLLGHDPDSDIAILQIDPKDMPSGGLIAAEWGDSHELEVGSLVWAMGSPYGLEQSVTSGIISAKHRAGQVGNPLQDFLQTDVAVNPGNSGGPLIDTQGRVVGINTAIVGQNYQGISFAVPSHIAREVYERIVNDPIHAVRRGYLGVYPESVSEERAKSAGLEEPRGVYVMQVMPDSPAAKLRLKPGDIILAWNGTAIESPAQLTRVICDTPIDSDATISIWRRGKEQKLRLKVGERPRI
jgi:serine protease Do